MAGDDIEAVLAEPRRLLIYRSLVRNGLSAVVLRMLPRTRARMNDACHDRFDSDFARFVGEVGPRTHYVRDVPAEFFAWAEPRWRADSGVPAYLSDLAAHELAHFAVASSDTPAGPPPREVTLDSLLAFSSAMRLMAYAWAVHELSADETSREEPRKVDVRLLAYRDSSHAVRWLELTPLAASIVAVGSWPASGSAMPSSAPAPTEASSTDTVLPGIAKLLADLGARGALARRAGRLSWVLTVIHTARWRECG